MRKKKKSSDSNTGGDNPCREKGACFDLFIFFFFDFFLFFFSFLSFLSFSFFFFSSTYFDVSFLTF